MVNGETDNHVEEVPLEPQEEARQGNGGHLLSLHRPR